IACLGTRALIPLLQRAAVLDRPNQRSSHRRPVPRGGGIAPVAAIALAWIALVAAGLVGPRVLFVLVGATLLAAVSWLDDLGDLLPGMEVGAGARLSRRCRQRPARLFARLSLNRHGRARPLEAGADLAALLPRRRDDYLAAPPRPRRAGVGGAPGAFLSARGA